MSIFSNSGVAVVTVVDMLKTIIFMCMMTIAGEGHAKWLGDWRNWVGGWTHYWPNCFQQQLDGDTEFRRANTQGKSAERRRTTEEESMNVKAFTVYCGPTSSRSVDGVLWLRRLMCHCVIATNLTITQTTAPCCQNSITPAHREKWLL